MDGGNFLTLSNKKPKWLEDKAEANKPKEEVTFIGEMGVDYVKDGKLPNGELYLWKKRRKK